MKTTGWPHNGQPSNRHKWRVVHQDTHGQGAFTEKCDRCGRSFNTRADTRGPVYCYPTAEWGAANPADDGALGDNAASQPCGEYGRPLRGAP